MRKIMKFAALSLAVLSLTGCGGTKEYPPGPVSELQVEAVEEQSPVTEDEYIPEETADDWNKVKPKETEVIEYTEAPEEKESVGFLTEEQLNEKDALGRTVRQVRDEFMASEYHYSQQDAEVMAYYAVTGKNLWYDE